MNQLSAIDTLECIVDGDTIVPGMSFVFLADTVGNTQYYNPSTKECTPDYPTLAENKQAIMLYPTCYSSNQGAFLVPAVEGRQWYYNNPNAESAAILDSDSNVKDIYKDRFALTSYIINGQTFPALQIIGNLASENNLTDVVIYFKGTFADTTVTCSATIAIKESVGEYYDILLTCVNENDASDTVIASADETLTLNAILLNNGVYVAPTEEWEWYRATASGLVKVENVAGVTEISTNTEDGHKHALLKLYDAAVENTEEYFAQVKYGNNTYRKGIQVSDTHDPYYINLGRSTASNLIKASQEVTYTPEVVDRGTGKTQSNWVFDFVAYDMEGNAKLSKSNTKSFTVKGTDLQEYGQLTIHITATKLE